MVTHGEENLGKEITLIIPTSLMSKGTYSDGKTTVYYSAEFSQEERSKFWENFKTLCGEGNWGSCERYMNAEDGGEE